jgi:dipeptidase
MTLKVDSIAYIHERATSTQQTVFLFVAQSRNWLPDPIGGILWFGVDDTYTMVYSPMYCGMTEVPPAYKVGNGDLLHFSPTSAFWVFSMVSNWAYTKYNYMIKDIRPVQQEMEQNYIAQVNGEIDMKANLFYKQDKAAAIKYITDYSVNTAQATVKRWQEMFQYLLVKYIDGNIKKEKDGKFETNPYNVPVMPSQPGYPEWWLKEIVREHGDVIKQIGTSAH